MKLKNVILLKFMCGTASYCKRDGCEFDAKSRELINLFLRFSNKIRVYILATREAMYRKLKDVFRTECLDT